ncbi:tryptophan--tRNA ligase, partial [bacterium]|nr:tryptophan--tRNA ligase [bacterium]
PLGWLERCPTFKEEVRDEESRERLSLGKLQYPILQTADVAVYKAEVVPIGKDQLPHLEIAREILRRFNGQYKNIFPEPQELLSEVPCLLGIDNRKMSKSYNNSINLRETSESLKEKIHAMITDPQRVRRNDPGDPSVCNVCAYQKIYTKDKWEELADGCRNATIGCRDCKNFLFESLNILLEGFRKRRNDLESQPGLIEEILSKGETKAHQEAENTMDQVRRAMGFFL